MQDGDRAYFHDRAEAEIEAARRANHPTAIRAHYLLAGYYLDRAFNPDAADAGEPPCHEVTRTNIPASRSARPSI